jgi:hypothetical protein
MLMVAADPGRKMSATREYKRNIKVKNKEAK